MSYRRSGSSRGWLSFLIGIALVFGLYYIAQGVRNYFRSGGLGVAESTQQADLIASATAVQIQENATAATTMTLLPTFTPVPVCVDFTVIVPSALVRQSPAEGAPIVTAFQQSEIVCVLGRDADSEWYRVDGNPETRRHDIAYMHESVIEAVNPTLTPSMTFTPLPTVTPMPTDTATDTPLPRPTDTPNPNATDTPTPTFTPSNTPAFESA